MLLENFRAVRRVASHNFDDAGTLAILE